MLGSCLARRGVMKFAFIASEHKIDDWSGETPPEQSRLSRFRLINSSKRFSLSVVISFGNQQNGRPGPAYQLTLSGERLSPRLPRLLCALHGRETTGD